MWILVAVFVSNGVFNEVSFQEFSSKDTCEAGIRTVNEMRIAPERSAPINMRCIPK